MVSCLLLFITLVIYASSARIGWYRLNIKTARVLPENASIFSTTELPKNKNLMATVGNGYIGHEIAGSSIYIAGVYNGNDGYQQSNNAAHRARIPCINSISLSFPNEKHKIAHYYTLDINDGVFFDSFISVSNEWQIEELIYAHRRNMNLLITQININNSLNTNSLIINLSNNAGSPSSDINFKYIQCPNDAPNNTFCQIGNTLLSEANYSTIQVGIINTNVPKTITIPPKTITTYYYAIILLTSLESSSVANDMVNLYNKLYSNKEQWLMHHLNEWSNIWQNGRIDIIGDTEQASYVYSSLYYIISSIRDNWYYGLSPGSLSSNGYNGTVFWDECTWMYPALLMLHETLGFSVLQYRYERIPGARINGNITGFDVSALRYPWESAFSGVECSLPKYPEGTREVHINADIALAIKQYFYATRNLTWLKQIGYPMLKGISNFWTQRVYYDEESKLYGWLNVQPPDEYHDNVNNSVYTNNGAAVSLNFSIEAAELLGLKYPTIWKRIVDNVYIPFDNKYKYHPEYDGYTIGTTVKQGDVILLSFPWQFEMSQEIHSNDLLLYANVTSSNGPEMTWSMFSINWMYLNDFKNAMKYFNKSYVSIQEPFKIWTESANGGGTVNFITGAGGYLQSFIFGFGGLRLFDKYLFINFKYIPWKQLNLIGIDYQYNSIHLNMYNTSITINTLHITVVYRNQQINNKLIVQYSDETTEPLNINETVTVPINKQPVKISVV